MGDFYELRPILGAPILHLDVESVVEDPELLEVLKQVCYVNDDVRAGWYGPGLPRTSASAYQAYANWATEHWAMYSGFLDQLPRDEPLKILDVGCGTGHATACLARLFAKAQVTGVDLDPTCIQFAEGFNGGSNLTFFQGDFEDPVPGGPFDLIFALEVFEHVPAERHDAFITRCLELLAPGGKLLWTTPNALDEADDVHGHIGLLNRERARAFYARHRSRVRAVGFYDNTQLLTRDPGLFRMEQPFEVYEATDRNRSHFWMVFE